MKRGEIWTVASGGGYGGKPRPAVVIQADEFMDVPSLTICGLTTDQTPADLVRVEILPTEGNGLRHASRIMTDKTLTVPKSKVRDRIGALEDADVVRLNNALMVFLGLAISPRSQRGASTAGPR